MILIIKVINYNNIVFVAAVNQPPPPDPPYNYGGPSSVQQQTVSLYMYCITDEAYEFESL